MKPVSGSILAKVVQDLSQAEDLPGVMRVVQAAARELSGADGITFVLRDGDQCHYADEDAIAPLWKGKRFPMTSCISGWVMLNARPAAIEDIYSDPRIPAGAYRPTFVKSLAMVPVRREDPMAAIGAYWAERHAPSNREVEVLQALADVTSVALTNVGLIADLRRGRAEAEDRAEEYARLCTRLRREVEQRKRAEADLRQVQKMETVGLLAGGIAHDFNNLLTAILGYSEVALEGLDEGSSLKEPILEIQSSAERASALTRQLLTLSRKKSERRIALRLDELVDSMGRLLRRLIPESVLVKIHLEAGAAHVHGDPGAIEQILLNLVVNARDAMPEGGTIRIGTRTMHLDAQQASTFKVSSEGAYVELSVEDSGIGMDDVTLERIFDPFFTTKAEGAGTGLGLSIVYGAVRQMGGGVGVTSTPGEGSRFEVVFPQAAESEEAHKPSGVRPGMPQGWETVLVVEDDQSVRLLVRSVLDSCGYRVLEAADGGQALETVRREPGRIDLLLTDSVMPHMNGRELARRVRELREDIKVITMSGYSEESLQEHVDSLSGMGVLSKPFTPSILAQKVRAMLDV